MWAGGMQQRKGAAALDEGVGDLQAGCTRVEVLIWSRAAPVAPPRRADTGLASRHRLLAALPSTPVS